MGIVYQARNTINNMIYIGRTIHPLNHRKTDHERNARKGSSLYLHRALRKYGFGAFEWRILIEVETEKELNYVERLCIKSLKTMIPNGYNMTSGGEREEGWKVSQETSEKSSKAMKAVWAAPGFRAKMSEIHKYRKPRVCLESTKAKISAANKGKTRSDEVKATMSKERTGKKRTADFCKRMSIQAKEAWKSRKRGITEEHKQKLRESNLGRRQSPEHVAKRVESTRRKKEAKNAKNRD